MPAMTAIAGLPSPRLRSSSSSAFSSRQKRRNCARPDFGRPLSRHDANLGAERIRNSRDKRQLWAGVARREQPADARSVAIDSPGELSLRDPEIDPQRVELADHLIGLLDLTSGA